MEILPEIEIIGLSLWLDKSKTLIFSDFHLGYEETLREKGFFLPKTQFQDVLQEVKFILNKVKPKQIIINGDLKHEFSKILSQEWKDVLRLIDFLLENCEELIIVKGNHDRFLRPIAGKREIKVVEDFQVDDILICHGDKIKETAAKTIIIGHEHPAIVLKELGKVEKFKCFLLGKWKKKDLIVMPSFNPILEGTDILKEELLSPYLEDISDFKVYVVGEEIYDFGKLKNLS
ncbi:MAG: metallophosphoesterase [Candidatus Woesearchaeota archaeon]